jgi:hypothetical protein
MDDDTDRLARRPERRAERNAERPKPEPSLGETIEMATRRLMTAIVVAGGLIAAGIYASRPEAPRYDAFATPDGRIVRVNLRSGTVLACEGRTCMIVVQRGQRLHRSLPDPAPQQAAPAPVPAQRALPAPEPKDEAPAEE